MSDLADFVLAGVIGHHLGQQEAQADQDGAVREWLASLPPEVQGRLLPLSPEILEQLVGITETGGVPNCAPTPPATMPPNFQSHVDEAMRQHRQRLRVSNQRQRLRTSGVFAIGFSIALHAIGVVLILPGRALIAMGEALARWAVQEEE